MKELPNLGIQRYSSVHLGEQVWLSEMGPAASAATVLMKDGKWGGQLTLPGFHEPSGDILVFQIRKTPEPQNRSRTT